MRMTWWMLAPIVACKGDDAAKSTPIPAPGTGSAPVADAAAVARGNIEVRGVALPEVVRGLEPLEDAQRPTLVATKSGIVVEGKAVVAIQEGVIDPSEKEGGAMGMKIPKLSHLLGKIPRADSFSAAGEKAGKALAEIAQRRNTKETSVVLMADPTTPAQRVVEVLAEVRARYPDVQFSTGFE